MICTFGDTTDVVWWRELQLPTRTVDRARRAAPAAAARSWGDVAEPTPTRATAELAGKTAKQAQARIVELLREAGDLVGEPKPITHAGEVLREAATARSRSSRAASGTSATAAATTSCAPRSSSAASELRWHPRVHAAALRVAGSRGSTATGSSAGSASSACRSRSGTRSTPTASPTTTHPIVPDEAALPVDPSSDVPAGLHRGPARQARRLRRRPRRDGHVGDVVAHARRSPRGWEDDPDLFARTFPMDLRPQAPEIIRTWLFYTVVRAHFEHDSLPWTRRRRSSGWCSTPTARRCRRARATWSRRWSRARAVRRRRGALLGGERPPGHRHRGRRGPDEGRSPARDQDPQRVEVRARRRWATTCRRRRRGRREPLDRSMLASLAALVDERDHRRSRPTTTHVRSTRPSASSGASATTTSSW